MNDMPQNKTQVVKPERLAGNLYSLAKHCFSFNDFKTAALVSGCSIRLYEECQHDGEISDIKDTYDLSSEAVADDLYIDGLEPGEYASTLAPLICAYAFDALKSHNDRTTFRLLALRGAELYPGDAAMLTLAGVAEVEFKNYEAAEKHFLKSGKINPYSPDNAESLLDLYVRWSPAVSVADEQRLRLAEKMEVAAENLLEMFPDNHMALYHLGEARMKMSRFDEAIDAYEQSIDICPNQYSAHINLSKCCMRAADQLSDENYSKISYYTKADNYFEKAQELQTLLPEHMHDWAMVKYSLRAFDQAEELLLAAIETDPQAFYSHRVLSELLFARGRNNDAFHHMYEGYAVLEAQKGTMPQEQFERRIQNYMQYIHMWKYLNPQDSTMVVYKPEEGGGSSLVPSLS